MKKNLILIFSLLLPAAPLRAEDPLNIDTHALRMSTPTPEEKIAKAEGERRDMLKAALEKIDALLNKEPGEDAGAPVLNDEDHKVVQAMADWLYIPTMNTAFWARLRKARGLISQNQALSGRAPFRRDDEDKNDYAYVKDAGDPSAGIYFTSSYMSASSNCRREVQTHEYFHFIVGAQHFYSTKDAEEAVKCPHHLAEFVSAIATGVTESCSSAASEH